MSQLPGRSELITRLGVMLTAWQDGESDGSADELSGPIDLHHLPEPKPPAIYAVGIVDYRHLVELDGEGMDKAIGEIAWRLDKLVRSGDLLGMVAPDTFVLAASSIAPSAAGVVMERIAGAVAMPLEIGGGPVSLRVAIGLAFAFDGASPELMLQAAERDMARSLGE